MRKIITVLFAFVSAVAISQTTLDPQLISTCGGSGDVGATHFDWSVGEPFIDFGGSSCDSIFGGFQHCAVDTLRIIKNNATIGGPTTFCSNNNVILTAPAGVSWLWSNGAVTQTVSINQSGNYKVRTTNSCGDTINSNFVTITVLNPPVVDICMVDVDSATLYQYNFIYWNKTPYPQADSFIIYRETSTNIYTRIGAVSKDSLSLFKDTARSVAGPNGGHPDYGSYKYKLQVLDTCGVYGAKSPYHSTVFFQDQLNGNFNWNQYLIEGMGSTPVSNFYLMRDDNNTNNFSAISTLSGSATLGTDPQYATYQSTANWRVDATGFNCTPTVRYGNNSAQGAVVKSRSNVKNNRTTAVHSKEINFRVYPNPSNNEFTVFLMQNGTNCWAQITNALGQDIKDVLLSGTETTVSVADLENGVYFLKVTENDRSCRQKLIVQH